MQERPVIKTAIPKHRYQLAGHIATLLGEVESGDGRAYRYILAFVSVGQSEPMLYVCSEPSPPAERADGAYRLRVVSELMSDVLDSDDRWGDLEAFADQGLKVGAQMLGLADTHIVKLM